MGDKHSYSNIGEEMKDALSDALQNGNFQTLNRLVSQTVTATLDEVGIHIPTDGSDVWSSRAQNADKAFGQTGADVPLWQQALGSDPGAGNTRRTADKGASQQRRYTGQASSQTFGSASRQQAGAFGQNASQTFGTSQNASQQHRYAGQASSQTFGSASGSRQQTGAFGQNASQAQSSASGGGQDVWQQRRQEQLKRQQAEQLRRQQQELARQQAEAAKRQQQEFQQQTRFRQQQEQLKQREAERLRKQEQLKAEAARRQQEQLRRQQDRQLRQQTEAARRQYRQQQTLRLNQQQQLRNSQAGHMTAASFIPMKRIGSVSGILLPMFGGIGIGFSSLMLMAAIGIRDESTLLICAMFLPLLAFSSFLLYLGITKSRRLRRAKHYASLCDSRMFVQISDLSIATGKPERYIVKDLQKILNAGIFPEGHLDRQQTCFMFNNTVFRQYLNAENERRRREQEAGIAGGSGRIGNTDTGRANGADASDGSPGQNAIIAEGMEYIRRLRELNDQIEGEVISAKLFRLEHLLKDIFDNIREHPEQTNRIHKLMEYYLPTTLKLVDAYADFDQISTPGNEIIKAKSEIENTLDTINQAFTELLNNLFQDAVFDATTDAQVLKTMLAKEGLTKEMEFATRRSDTETPDREKSDGGKSDEQ